MRTSVFLAATASLLALTSCAAAAIGAVGAVGVVALQEKTLGTAIDDSTLSSQIKAQLVSRGGYGEVDVEVASGLVLLSGRVQTPEMRVKAEEIAWRSSRALEVANEIQVESTHGIRGNLSDEFITARVRTRIIASRKVRGVNFNIETYNGVVYLLGIARTQAELDRAAEIASTTRGVREVVVYAKLRDPVQRPSQFQQVASSEGELAGGPRDLTARGAAGRSFKPDALPKNKVLKVEDIDDGTW
ncbi:MAG: BON domain-containing protein [Pseudomonadota bacterium]